jgi:LacI family transcriptional regulator
MPSEHDVRPESVVGMRDIARKLGVSVGTVDRGLHGKPGIKPDTRARVLATAETLGYRPNLAARYLRCREQLRISVRVPDRPSFFWETLRDGLREAAAPFAPSLGLEFRTHDGTRAEDAALPLPGLGRISSGLIVGPGDPATMAGRFEDVTRRDIPSVCVGADSPDPRIPSVSVDHGSIGALAGELLGRFLPGGGEVAIVATSVATRAHADQVRGFDASLSMFGARLKLAAVADLNVDERDTHRRTRDLLRAHPRLKGLYVSAGEALPVLQAAREEGRLSGLAVVTTDLCPDLFDWIRTGAVAATIYQRPLTQGHGAFQLLYQYLQTRVPPTPHRQVVAPYAVMSSNLHIVLQRLALARATAVPHDQD